MSVNFTFCCHFRNRCSHQGGGNTHVAASALSHHLTNLEAQLKQNCLNGNHAECCRQQQAIGFTDHARLILKATETAEADIKLSGYSVGGDVCGYGFCCQGYWCRLGKNNYEGSASRAGNLRELERLYIKQTDAIRAGRCNCLQSAPRPNGSHPANFEERLAILGNKKLIGEKDDDITFDEILDLPLICLIKAYQLGR